MSEIEQIRSFIDSFDLGDQIPAMEQDLKKAIGYQQRIGELLNAADYNFKVNYAGQLDKLLTMEEETETTRKAKLEAWTALDKRTVDDLKTIKSSLRTIIMSLMQSIKTRREEKF